MQRSPRLVVHAASDADTRAASRMRVTFEREVDGRHIAEIGKLPGCVVYGRTRVEAEARVRALAREIICDKVQHGERVPGVRAP
jgi:predicted RNase H-like HicB family nuclease